MLTLNQAKRVFFNPKRGRDGVAKTSGSAASRYQLHFRTDHLKSVPPLPAHLHSASSAPMGEIKSVSIHITSDQDKLNDMVCFVDDVRTFDKTEPHTNGLYDLRMGPSDLRHQCATCVGNLHQCPKHNGAVLFLRYKYHVSYLKVIYMLLNIVCHNCHQIRIPTDSAKFAKIMQITNPIKRLTELYKQCRFVDYCGASDEGGGNKSGAALQSPQEFVQYLKQREANRSKVKYRGCGSVQRVYVSNRKDPMNIRCFDRIPTKRRVRAAAVDDEGPEGHEGTDVTNDQEDTDDVKSDIDELKSEMEEETDADEGQPEMSDEDDEAEDDDEDEDMADADSDDGKHVENHEPQEDEDEDVGGGGVPVEPLDDEDDLDHEWLNDIDRKLAEQDSELRASMGATDWSTAPQDRDTNIADIHALETDTAAVPLQLRHFDQWIQSNAKSPSLLTSIPIGCAATLRSRPIPEKLKSSLPSFDADSEYLFGPNEAHAIFKNISKHDYFALAFGGLSEPKNLCSRIMAIVPAAVQMRGGSASADLQRQHGDTDIVKNLKRILIHSREVYLAYNQLMKMIEGSGSMTAIREQHRKLSLIEEKLHMLTAAYVDRDASGIAMNILGRNKVPSKSIIQNFVTKFGIVRGGMNSKRCDNSARTTISPAYGLDIDEMGLPQYIAIKSTSHETVNGYNQKRLQHLIHNGPFVYVGAKKVWRGDTGMPLDLQFARAEERRLYSGDVVERHQMENEMVIMNRQPTLHRPSMMAHRIRVHMKFNALLPMSDTQAYNADFDGDQMNLHFPQSDQSKVETGEIMGVRHQMVNSQGICLISSKHNGILGSFLTTDNRQMFSKAQVFECLTRLRYFPYLDASKNTLAIQMDHLPSPACWKFKEGRFQPLWTGKQVISMCFRDLPLYKWNGSSGSSGSSYLWENETVLIHRGQLVCGQLTKKQLGPDTNVIWACFWKQLGSSHAAKRLSDHCRLMDHLIDSYGFSAKMSDLDLPERTHQHIQSVVHRSMQHHVIALTKHEDESVGSSVGGGGVGGASSANHAHDALTRLSPESEAQATDHLKTLTSDLSLHVAEHYDSLRKCSDKQRQNAFAVLVQSQTKGSGVHLSQMRALIGQVEVQGRRSKPTFLSRPFPHVSPHSLHPRSFGFVAQSYIQGSKALETYINCQKGNEETSQSSTKIADVGYLQRRLTKAMEDEILCHDGTIRSLGQISMFTYSDEGFDAAYSARQTVPSINWTESKIRQYFYSGCLEGLGQIGASPEIDVALQNDCRRISDTLDRWRQFQVQWSIDLKAAEFDTSVHVPIFTFPHLLFCCKSAAVVAGVEECSQWMLNYMLQFSNPDFQAFGKHVAETKSQYPSSRVSPQECFMVVRILAECCQRVFPLPATRIKFYAAMFTSLSIREVCVRHRLTWSELMWVGHTVVTCVMAALVQPGEMTGIATAQSASQPTAQMTLNTFHVGANKDKEENYTLARLEEIARKAAEISKSIVRVPIVSHLTHHSHVHRLLELYLTHRILLYFVRRVYVAPCDLSEKQQQQQPGFPSLTSLNKALFRVWEDDDSKYTKPHGQWSSKSKTPHPMDIYSMNEMVFELEKTKLLDLNLTLYDIVKVLSEHFKHSAHFHQWTVSPMCSRRWEIRIRMCCKSQEFMRLWKRAPPKTVEWSQEQRLESQNDESRLYESESEVEEGAISVISKSGAVVSSSSETQRNLYMAQEQRQHEFVLKHMQGSILSLTILGNSKVSQVAVEDSHVWKYSKEHKLARVPCKMLYLTATDFELLFQTPCLDISKFQSNNICQVEKMLDVHAAMSLTLREIRKVYESNGQHIDTGVLRQIVAFMGRKGELQPFSRTGFNENPELGFLKKTSFEKVVQNLTTASQTGEVDRLDSGVSNVMIGKMPPIGTRYGNSKIVLNEFTLPATVLQNMPRLMQWNQEQLNRRLLCDLSGFDLKNSFLRPLSSTHTPIMQPDYGFLKYDHADSNLSTTLSAPQQQQQSNSKKRQVSFGVADVPNITGSTPKTSNAYQDVPRGVMRRNLLKNDGDTMKRLDEASERLVALLPSGLKFAPASYRYVSEENKKNGPLNLSNFFKRIKTGKDVK